MILHHTDCGIIRLADYPEQLAAFFEMPADELESKAVDDPYAAVRVDAAIARHTLPPSPARVRPGLRRQHRAHRDRRPGHPGVAALCKESATADDVRAAMPHPVVGSAADPIALEPVDDVVTALVDNVYDALLTGDNTISPSAVGSRNCPSAAV